MKTSAGFLLLLCYLAITHAQERQPVKSLRTGTAVLRAATKLAALADEPEATEEPELTEEPDAQLPVELEDSKRRPLIPRPLPPKPFSNCKEAPRLHNVRQVDAGFGMVVARTSSNRLFFLIGSRWQTLGSSTYRHVSVGPAGIWAVDLKNRVHKYVAGNFRSASGVSMLQVDAGGDGHVVGVSTSNSRTYCLRSSAALAYSGVGSLGWSPLAMSMRYYSCGPYSCWGVDSRSRVYVTQKITPSSCANAAWRQVHGISMKMVEVGTDGSVYALGKNGRVYQRGGVFRGRPLGNSWINVPMCMQAGHVSYDLGHLWVVSKSGLLLQCSRPTGRVIRPLLKETEAEVA